MKQILPALFLAFVPLLSAQPSGPSKAAAPSRLLSIQVTGSSRYTPEQIIAATGLQPGQNVTEDDFKDVSRRLGDSGAFSDIAYSFQFNAAGTKLELRVTDSKAFVPVRFENFVWFSDQELFERLSTRVPLFQGQLPVGGNLADDISEALQVLAIERNLRGRVDYLRAGPVDGPMEAYEFSISGAPISVRKIAFTGAGPALLPQLEAAARKLSGQDYSRSRLVLQANKNLLTIFLEHGYLKAVIADPQPKVVEDTPDETLVDVTFTAIPGLQYKVSGIRLSGYSNVFPLEKLRALIHMKPGEVANAVEADGDIESLKKLYGTRGYMGIQIRSTPQLNDADSAASYVIEFQEGSVYKMGDLEVRGLDSKATDRMVAAWRLLPGQTYDSGYPKLFLESIAGLYPADQWKISVRETAEEQDKIVDVSLRFDARR